jgi:pSer/pThr/pTyr-binding forkhead associated (FHA) protein
VVTSIGEWELERGVLSIGRAADANMLIDDPLVSRIHARLSVLPDERVIVEDMHSTNGLFINGMRLARPTAALSEGDRLLIGTTEISVFSTRSSATMPISTASASQRCG